MKEDSALLYTRLTYFTSKGSLAYQTSRSHSIVNVYLIVKSQIMPPESAHKRKCNLY